MAMTTAQRLEQLRRAKAEARAAQKEAVAANARVRKQVAAALEAGVSAEDAARIVGVTRTRVYAMKKSVQRPT